MDSNSLGEWSGRLLNIVGEMERGVTEYRWGVEWGVTEYRGGVEWGVTEYRWGSGVGGY